MHNIGKIFAIINTLKKTINLSLEGNNLKQFTKYINNKYVTINFCVKKKNKKKWKGVVSNKPFNKELYTGVQ